MIKLTKSQIKEIASEVESGMKVYINPDTLEFMSILDWEDSFGDTGFWEEEEEKIMEEWDKYIVIEKMESYEAFRIMEDFTNEVEDERLREDLIKILNRKSPFANFKAEIEFSLYRKLWFAFKSTKYEEDVRKQLEMNEIEIEE